MPSFYTIWKMSPNRNGLNNQPVKMNMTVAEATTYIVKNRDSLKGDEQFFTENQATNEVDMMFTKRDTITPNKPMWLDGSRLVSYNPMNMKQKSLAKYSNPAWSKTKKSRGKWIGNMFKSSNKRLQNITKTGTPKQKALAKKILAKRKK